MPSDLGEKIRKLRKEQGLTLDKLAEMTESSKSYIWELENKNPPRPSAEKVAKIADKLGVEIQYLLDEGEAIGEEDSIDAKFYRDYRKLDSDTRRKIRTMTKLIGGDE